MDITEEISKPMVSVIMLTYNQEKFVEHAIRSVLNQKVLAPIELLIADDASTDSTPKIIHRLAKENKNVIHAYYRKKNSCHPTENSYFLLSKARGKYITYLWGDDYYTDNSMLQTQYDFLENNKDFSGCVVRAITVDQNENQTGTNDDIDFELTVPNHVFDIDFFIRSAKIPGHGMMTRNYFESKEWSVLYKASPTIDDHTLAALALIHGPIYQIQKEMMAYRAIAVTGGVNFNSIIKGDKKRFLDTLKHHVILENFLHDRGVNTKTHEVTSCLMKVIKNYRFSDVIKVLMDIKGARYILKVLALKPISGWYFEFDGKSECVSTKTWQDFMKDNRKVILFGSGDVAAEYINRYGWKENILFTVDNDRYKQGKSSNGYLIRKPADILLYPDTKILITNSNHEADIEKQLIKMGVSNYYCYCKMSRDRVSNKIANYITNIL